MNRFTSLILLLWMAVGCKSEQAVLPETSAASAHLSLGNPTRAVTDFVSSSDNYLMERLQYALSYNKRKGHANWVSWELSPAWLGNIDRQNNYRPDADLPDGWYRVSPDDYSNSGFDRGLLCPPADRTKNVVDNSATFLMTNIIPQVPELNREAWTRLEEFSRGLVAKGHRLFIVAGAYGTGGEGSAGKKNTLRNNINVPARIYKVIVAIPNGGGIDKINENTAVIAVDFPNVASAVKNKNWSNFITTPGAIEKAAGIDLFANLPEQISKKLEAARYQPTGSPIRSSSD